MWAWGLDPNHDPDLRDSTQTPVDPNVKQAMVNLLFDMGAAAGTLQGGLVPPPPRPIPLLPPSLLHLRPAEPVSRRTRVSRSPAPPMTPAALSPEWRFRLTATTWHPASTTSFNSSTGTITGWTYNWTPASAGTVTIRARAIDDSLNIGAAVSVTVTVKASSSVSLFSGLTPVTPSGQ